MKQITEDYCSFEVAKLLKQKGFDIPVYQYYFPPSNNNLNYSEFDNDWNSVWKHSYSAPTHQMALKWLREELNLYIEIRRNLNTFYYGWKVEQGMSEKAIFDYKYDSYEKAVEAALKYTLENLI